MLSTFFSQLQQYFSKYFIVGTFLPVLAFVAGNCISAYLSSEDVRQWVADHKSLAGATYITTSIGVVLIILAYTLSSLSTFLRRLLETGGWRGIARFFVPQQVQRMQEFSANVDRARMNVSDLRFAPNWQKAMLQAHVSGQEAHRGVSFPVPTPDPLAADLSALRAQRGRNEMLDADLFEKAVNEVKLRLSQCDADASPKVSQSQDQLLELIEYGQNRATIAMASAQNEFLSNFGAQSQVAPTKMGNIANTIQSYALRRYRCNLEVIWSNLQRVVQRDDKSFAALLEAKTQLDFLIAFCWLSLVFSLAWMFITGAVLQSRVGFIWLSLTGPFVSYLWYRAAAEQYRSFADVSMTCLDAFRLDLLRDLHLRTPSDVDDERFIWESLDHLVTYSEERNFRYEPGPPKTP
jgi:hypothetical protein